MTPHDKLMAAISIIQNEILARNTLLVPEKLFPNRHFDTLALEVAEQMLADLLPVIDLA
jgi:hypothetical protein